MFWTGRGMPRVYCKECRGLISGYDEAAQYESGRSTSRRSKQKGRSSREE
jgi:hypothetical protein